MNSNADIQKHESAIRFSRDLYLLLTFQGVFYALTALWGLIDIDSFMLVTGPKTDIWLVKTFAWLILAIALTLLLTAYLQNFSVPIAVLAICSAAFLAGTEIFYVAKGIISSIYLMDAVIEILFVLSWLTWFHREN